MANFFEELKRRHVIRVGIAYLIASWIIIQFVDVIGPTLELPVWLDKVVLILLAIGLPIALIMAWAFDLTPQGIKPTGQLEADESPGSNTGRKLDRIIIVALVLALGYFAWDKFLATPVEVVSARAGTSIAVLPFADLSAAGDQEYFADGISEELLNLLAKTPNLRVAARTSSFQFKGQNQDVQKVAAQLGVETILEGSVRKSGNRLRITAQLIDGRDGFHIWSETYDRDLDDIFAVQDEIARAIVTALKETLGIAAEMTAAEMTIPTLNMEAHSAYLLGRHSLEKRTRESLAVALESFRHAIELDPNYAPAWVGIGNTYQFLSERSYGKMPHQQAIERARGALDRALELDPDLAEAQASLGIWYSNRGDAANALPHFKRAIESNPNAAQAWHWYSLAMNSIARFDEAFDATQTAAALDPLSMIINHNLAGALIARGRLDEARVVAEKMRLIEPNSYWGPIDSGSIHAAKGQIAEAIMAYRQALALKGFIVVLQLSAELANIGLAEAAYETLRGTPLEGVGEIYRGDFDAALVFARANWPSSPGDGMAHGYRGLVELIAGDLATAVSYFEKAQELLGPAMTLAFSVGQAAAYRRFGDQTKAVQTLVAAKVRLQAAIAGGIENEGAAPMAYQRAGILAFERKFSEAFHILRKLVKDGRLGAGLEIDPVFAELREQPEYAQLLADYEAWKIVQQARLKELEAVAAAGGG